MAERARPAQVTGLDRRAVCIGLSALATGVPAAGGARNADAVVRRQGGTHASLGAALRDAPPGDAPYRILLGAGRWQEKLLVDRSNVILTGESRRDTVLTSAVASGHPRPDGGNWGTFGSATLTVEAAGFTVRNLTIENGFDYPANLRSRALADSQAVALALGVAADRSLIERVDLIGHQDTFYLRAGRARVRECLIAGSVDFIFGGAAALFEGCEIRSRLRAGEILQGYIAAPSTPRDQPHGLVFDRCRLTRERGVADGAVWLGRPWRAGGNPALLGSAAYLDCWMDAHIAAEGWTSMGYKGPAGYPVTLAPADARLFEYRSRGPGAARHPARRQLDHAGAARARAVGAWPQKTAGPRGPAVLWSSRSADQKVRRAPAVKTRPVLW